MTAFLTGGALQEITGAADEVLARLEAYVALLGKWQAKINLVGRDSLKDVWRRHILDSAQLQPLLPSGAKIVADIGSGAGFPGLVLAIITDPGGPEFHLIESNAKKCAFLREACRITEAGAIIHHVRAEDLINFKADIVVARAVSSLEKLLEYAKPLLRKDGQCLFLKGKNWREELTKSQKNWIINESTTQSLSDPSGIVLKLEGIVRRDAS
ncbi:MAG: 16S rRNA (guanine(527)-N(7))-methyltransferase RsmG [Rhodospirillales bacterium]